jgi:Immunity protein 26
MQIPSAEYLFGRVILADPPRGQAPMPCAYLIYVYRHRGLTKTVEWSSLRADDLLLPPVWINRMPWTKGFFEHQHNAPLEPGDLLNPHCFHRWTGDYVDERGRKLSGPVEPCGDWALSSYRWLDDHVSEALGIPQAPD